MRCAIRRLVLGAAIPSRVAELEAQFNDYEKVLTTIVPSFVLHVHRARSLLSANFEVAFGFKFSTCVRLAEGADLRAARTALLFSDQYHVMAMARFAMKYLMNTVNINLAEALVEYSKSSRLRRTVADTVTRSRVAPEDAGDPERTPEISHEVELAEETAEAD